MRRRLLINKLQNGGGEMEVGNIVLVDKSTLEKVFVRPDDLSQYSPADYTPIGVVVIPASHDVYGTGECAIVSLRGLHDKRPYGGDMEAYGLSMYWGPSNINISGIKDRNYQNYCGSPALFQQSVIGLKNESYIPTDNYSNYICEHDKNSGYPSVTADKFFSPSPYLTDGSRNKMYYQTTDPSSDLNCLADFDGQNNTKKIVEERGPKDYESWTPSQWKYEDYPMASCCDMFYTDGTNQGDWYQPAAGEVGYLASRYKKISDSFEKIKSIFQGFVIIESINSLIVTSTETSTNGIKVIFPSNGLMNGMSKSSPLTTRAFTKLKN